MIASAARHDAELSPSALAIARSVIYASLFDYPLTPAQLHEGLLESRQTEAEILSTYRSSEALQAVIEFRDGFFFPRGCERSVSERREREARSRAFLSEHRRLLSLICALPYTRLVALSGSLAHLNLASGGDLDLFMIASDGHVWSVTVAVIVLARLLRRRGILCANFVVSDAQLALEQQDLFTANQVIHLKPLAGEDVFQKLLAASPFVARFYPNYRGAPAGAFGFARRAGGERARVAVEALCAMPARGVEAFCRRLYQWHLRRRAGTWRSPEQVRLQPGCLKLHTRSHRQDVLERFDRALQDALEGQGKPKGKR